MFRSSLCLSGTHFVSPVDQDLPTVIFIFFLHTSRFKPSHTSDSGGLILSETDARNRIHLTDSMKKIQWLANLTQNGLN